MKNGKTIGGPLLKQFLSRLAGISLHYLIRLPTQYVTNSFKLYKKTPLESIDIQSAGGFEVGMEITVKSFLNGYRITEIPTTWIDRVTGESKFRFWKWIPHYLYWYLFAVTHTIKRLLTSSVRSNTP